MEKQPGLPWLGISFRSLDYPHSVLSFYPHRSPQCWLAKSVNTRKRKCIHGGLSHGHYGAFLTMQDRQSVPF